jgi:hypothetical protein
LAGRQESQIRKSELYSGIETLCFIINRPCDIFEIDTDKEVLIGTLNERGLLLLALKLLEKTYLDMNDFENKEIDKIIVEARQYIEEEDESKKEELKSMFYRFSNVRIENRFKNAPFHPIENPYYNKLINYTYIRDAAYYLIGSTLRIKRYYQYVCLNLSKQIEVNKSGNLSDYKKESVLLSRIIIDFLKSGKFLFYI